jgi:hypothetical protein
LRVKGRVERVELAGWSARKWLARYRHEGESGLVDRPSTPGRVHNRTDERRVQAIAALRRLRMTSAEIAEVLNMAVSTVSGIPWRASGWVAWADSDCSLPSATSAGGRVS